MSSKCSKQDLSEAMTYHLLSNASALNFSAHPKERTCPASVISAGQTGRHEMQDKMDVGYGDSRATRDGISYDEGRASARFGLSFAANPFMKDLEPDRYRSWSDGYTSYKAAN